jgi:predicted CXXCH cytochrome family protein
VHFDHAEVMGTCVSCHNGTIAQGEGLPHPATSQALRGLPHGDELESAEDRRSHPDPAQRGRLLHHLPQRHTGAGQAGEPHRDQSGVRRLPPHHNWLGATFDHTGITSGCVSCHNGVKAVGKQGSHMPTTNLCENCHTTGIGTKTPSWIPSGSITPR